MVSIGREVTTYERDARYGDYIRELPGTERDKMTFTVTNKRYNTIRERCQEQGEIR